MQPDIFSVSLFGKAYKFRLNKQQGSNNIISAFVFNDNNAEIEYNLSNDSFTIVDDRGYIYVFSTKEYATNYTNRPDHGYPITSTTIPATARQAIQTDANGFDETTITSWKLDSVESPTGEMLNFNYQKGLHFTFPQIMGYFDFNDHQWFPGGQTTINSAPNVSATTTALETQYLTSITGDFGSVEFVLEARDDLLSGYEMRDYCNIPGSIPFITGNLNSGNGQFIAGCHGQPGCSFGTSLTDYRLKRIDIKDYDGVLIENVDFTYSYFNMDDISGANKERFIRLRLDQVDIGDKKYTMSYINPDDLPAKDSFDVDFWGYYNGAGNSHNVPSVGRFYTTKSTSHHLQNFINYSGADRGSNFDYGKHGLLGKISYPTGGYTTLKYEAHKALVEATQPYIVTDELPSGDIQWTTLIDESKYRFTYQYLKKAKTPSYNLYDMEYVPPVGDPITYEANIMPPSSHFSSNYPIVFTADCTLKCETNCAAANYGNIGLNEPRYVIKRVSDGQVNNVIFKWGDFPSGTGSPTSSGFETFFLPPGDYFVEMVQPSPFPPGAPVVTVPEAHNTGDGQFEVQTYDTGGGDLPTVLEQFEVGGARVAFVTHYDENGAFISKAGYDYTFYDNSDPDLNSSGKLMDELIFFSKVYGHNSYSPIPWSYTKLKFQSNPALPITGSASGSHIGYSQVRQLVLDSNDGVLGETITNFSNESNLYYTESFCREYNTSTGTDPDVCIENTFVVGLGPRHTFDYLNGQVVSTNVYNRAGELVLKEDYEYSNLVGQLDTGHYASVIPIRYQSSGEVPTDGSTYYTYALPVDFSMKSLLAGKETTRYFDNGSELFSEENYIYDSVNHNLLEKETEIFEGDRVRQKYYYPFSTEVSSEPGMWNLRNKNQLNTIVKVENFRNTAKLGETHYSFATFNGNTLATKMSTGKASQTILTDRMTYDKYDSEGRLLQKTPKSGRPTSYIWGYNKQYIVAKVENASYTNIEGLSSFGSGFVINDALNSTQENQLRSLTNAMVTVYTYIPGVGVETITGPNDYTLTYEYDADNRLQYVRDEDNNIVEEHLYNLNNDNIPGDLSEGSTGGTTTPGADDDGDGWTNGLEDTHSTGATVPCSFPYGLVSQDTLASNTWRDLDCDGDGISNGDEMINGTNPLENDTGTCNPFCPKSMQEYLDVDRSMDLTTGYKRLVAYVQFQGHTASPGGGQLDFGVLALGGSGNYEYRWREKGEEFASDFGIANSYTWSYSCFQPNDPNVGVVCEIKDTTTGDIVIARWSNKVELVCN